MTVDEELTQLEDNLRKLKIEYDIYFGGGSKRPPNDLDWRVQSGFKKYGDSQRLTFQQRFRFNSLQQKYAVFSDLWRKKMRVREEGYRRPADMLLAIQGIRTEDDALKKEEKHKTAAKRDGTPMKVKIADPHAEPDTLRALYDALTTARLESKDRGGLGTFDNFTKFVEKKNSEIRSQYHCDSVEYQVETKDGKVRLKARPKK